MFLWIWKCIDFVKFYDSNNVYVVLYGGNIIYFKEGWIVMFIFKY